MSQKKRTSGLGRGLSSLLGVPEETEETVQEESKPDVSRETTSKQAEAAEKLEKTAANKRRTPKKPEPVANTEEQQTHDGKMDLPGVQVLEKKRQVSRPSDMFFEGSGSKKKSSMSDLMSARTSGLRAPRKDVPASNKESPSEENNNSVEDSSVSRETSAESISEGVFAKVDVAKIVPNPRQPRQEFNEEELNELAASIREVGVLQPIVVRPVSGESGTTYEIVMGERRWRASQLAEQNEIPAIVRETPDVDLLRDALLENLHRSQLNPLEEAAAYQNLLNEYGCSQEELSKKIGRSRPRISNTLRLMNLPALVQRRVASGVLSAGHARALLGLPDAASMEKVAQRIVNEGLSVRAVEELVAAADAPREVSRETSRREPQRHERLDYFANALSDRLATNVKISLGAKKGRMSIEFASVDDLNRIMDLIAPDGITAD